jgi:NTP pyrophosphatase (non-canonical NTP hydrolase)
MSDIWKEYADLVNRLKSNEFNPVSSDFMHSAFGCATESGEILDAIKKAIFYGRNLDEINLREEYGDLLWYIQLGLNALGLTIDDVVQTNMSKLIARYGDKFSSEKAVNRDLTTERKILENDNGK